MLMAFDPGGQVRDRAEPGRPGEGLGPLAATGIAVLSWEDMQAILAVCPDTVFASNSISDEVDGFGRIPY